MSKSSPNSDQGKEPSKALDPKWLSQQPAQYRAGLLLEAYRERENFRRGGLAAKLDMKITDSYIKGWENGAYVIPEEALPKIRTVLNLNETEYDGLVCERNVGKTARQSGILPARPVKHGNAKKSTDHHRPDDPTTPSRA